MRFMDRLSPFAAVRSFHPLVLLLATGIAVDSGAWGQQPAPLASVRFKIVAPTELPAQTGSPQSLQGQSPESLPPGEPLAGLSLGQLEQISLASNPSLARAASLAAAARGNWTQVGLMPNPSVGYEGQQLGSGGQAEQHGVLFTQEIVRKDKLRLNRAVAQQEVARAEQELAAQQRRVLTDVRIAFYRELLAQRQIDITAELLSIGRQGVQATESLFRAQEGGRVDILQAQVELENAAMLADNARNRHWAAWQSLAAVAGQPGLHPQPLVGDAYAPACIFDPHEMLTRLLATSPAQQGSPHAADYDTSVYYMSGLFVKVCRGKGCCFQVGESPAPARRSLQPVVIEAAVEVTKLSKSSMERAV